MSPMKRTSAVFCCMHGKWVKGKGSCSGWSHGAPINGLKCGRWRNPSKDFRWRWMIATKNKPSDTFHYTGCLIGILVMVYYNPHINEKYKPLYRKQPGAPVSLSRWRWMIAINEDQGYNNLLFYLLSTPIYPNRMKVFGLALLNIADF